MNAEKLERYANIPEEERKLSEDLLYNRGADPVAAFAAHFRSKKPSPSREADACHFIERLPRYIIEGSKDGLIADLNEALKTLQAARDHQWPADEGHGRSRPTLQRQQAHRRRSAADRPRR